jgi:ABC-2 type transport system ATP-binding protein
MDAIEIRGLTKGFRTGFWMRKNVQALRGLDLSVRAGEIFGFLGPNGAGKSTTIKILTGLIRQDGGEVRIFGAPPGSDGAKRRIGFLPENPVFYEHLSGQELLEHYAKLLGLDRAKRRARVAELLGLVGMQKAARLQMRRYSKGMVQRIGIAQALLQDPDLVILDEPTSGLDPLGRHDVRELMLSLRSRGTTVFFSTHIVPDVEMVCDRVAFLASGKLMKVGTVPELLAREGSLIEINAADVREELRRELGRYATSIRDVSGLVSMLVDGDDKAREAMELLWRHGAVIRSMQPRRGGLEALFAREVAN